ncbi:hypothetical protein SDC9_125323 [bioreactor metagenome]|uniref:Uncharacterized protein n=1 Tax=bioreactor metagenome TaxID=1076179 RepID=A0A645CNG5_9ZZZZ
MDAHGVANEIDLAETKMVQEIFQILGVSTHGIALLGDFRFSVGPLIIDHHPVSSAQMPRREAKGGAAVHIAVNKHDGFFALSRVLIIQIDTVVGFHKGHDKALLHFILAPRFPRRGGYSLGFVHHCGRDRASPPPARQPIPRAPRAYSPERSR